MQDQVALVASTWLVVRLIRPYVSAVTRLVKLPEVDGQGVWLLVYMAALLVVALESANAGETLTAPELLTSALGVTAAAIGTDQFEKKTR